MIFKILLNPKLDYDRVCSVWPVVVKSSATFVIDVTKLKHPDDVRRDFFGRWIHSGSHPIPFKAKVTEDDMELECCAAIGEVYYLVDCIAIILRTVVSDDFSHLCLVCI